MSTTTRPPRGPRGHRPGPPRPRGLAGVPRQSPDEQDVRRPRGRGRRVLERGPRLGARGAAGLRGEEMGQGRGGGGQGPPRPHGVGVAVGDAGARRGRADLWRRGQLSARHDDL